MRRPRRLRSEHGALLALLLATSAASAAGAPELKAGVFDPPRAAIERVRTQAILAAPHGLARTSDDWTASQLASSTTGIEPKSPSRIVRAASCKAWDEVVVSTPGVITSATVVMVGPPSSWVLLMFPRALRAKRRVRSTR